MAAEPDALATTKTIISDNWTSGNTDSVTPNFFVTTEQPLRIDYNFTATTILIYLASHTTEPNGLGPSHPERTVDRVSVDIRTKKSRSHLRNCYNEVRRIFASRVNTPDSNFQQWIPIGFQDFSTIEFFRYVYDLNLRNWVLAR